MNTHSKRDWLYFAVTVVFLAGSCGSNSSNTPSMPPSCAGATVGVYCWYFGEMGKSCDEVCANHGGCNAKGITYAGSQGAAAKCEAVLTALNAPADTLTGVTEENDASTDLPMATGCAVAYLTETLIARYVNWPGSCTAAASFHQRACACKE